MTRRCSHCSNNGHNSRTCPNRAGGVKLFGVRLTDGSIKKSASMGNLSSAHYSSSSSPNPGSPSSDPMNRDQNAATAEGYASDDHAHASCSSNCRTERKKGTPWSEEEHRMFLIGLQKLGKGDWRGISRNYVVSRTPTQVASHAQKYFIRQTNAARRKRRSSLFDMAPDMSIDPMPIEEDQQLPMEDQQFLPSPTPQSETSSTLPSLQSENSSTFPSLHLSLETENEALKSTPIQTPTETEESTITQNFQPLVPAFFPAFLTVPYSLWTPNIPFPPEETSEKQHPIVKPIPIHLKRPINIDELVGMSNLTLGEENPGRIEPSSLSVKLLGDPSRQSAFHAKPAGAGGSDLSQKESSVIHAA